MFFRATSSSLSDVELVAKYRASGDLQLVSELFGRYTSMIYGVCVKYLRDRDDAKDAVMQVFEKLPQALQNHEIANFKSWVYVMARNHCLMQLRSMKGKKFEGLEHLGVETDPTLHLDDEPALENDISKLEKCLETLTTDQKTCVRMFYLAQKCYKEISDETGFDYNQVKSYIQNGKRNLKICMEKNG